MVVFPSAIFLEIGPAICRIHSFPHPSGRVSKLIDVMSSRILLVVNVAVGIYLLRTLRLNRNLYGGILVGFKL
jgi:hypothetical protein